MNAAFKQRGRPRAFDRQEALRQAMHVFWALGYEGATLADLQAAMGGITAPSFYAAFGSKEALFKEAVELYRTGVGTTTLRALAGEGTARIAIEAMLRDAVDSFCRLDQPRGCLIVLGTMNCSRASKAVQNHLHAFRLHTPRQIKKRLERGVQAGDLPSSLDLTGMAAFYTTVLHGLSIQARDGVSQSSLLAVVKGAMAAWEQLVHPQRSSKANTQ